MTVPRVPLRDALSTPPAKRAYVRRLFSTIADRYDLITVVLSFGLDRTWKKRLVALIDRPHGRRVVDLACGTGDIAFEAARAGAVVTGLDITLRMIQAGAVRERPLLLPVRERPRFLVGDMMDLPIASSSVDVVTTGYGIRNVPELNGALAEIHRVLKPGGQFLSLDFNRPSNGLVRGIYLSYLTVIGSLLGLLLHREPDTYRYIPESIRRYPGADAVCDLLRAQGFGDAEWHRVLGGLLAIHVARK